ncbi:hypothetical protein DPMN_092110, partial [Dreissena polymorpha]
MVFISTVLRCPYVKRAANTVLLRCYADRCRPAAGFTAFTFATFKIILLRYADLYD